MKLYTIFDVKERVYSPLQCHVSLEAFEQFLQVLINGHSELPQHKYPEDFLALEVGEFDKDSGEIIIYDNKNTLYTFMALRKQCKFCQKVKEHSHE